MTVGLRLCQTPLKTHARPLPAILLDWRTNELMNIGGEGYGKYDGK